MIEINLIPDIKREYLRTRTVRNFVISISIVVGVVVVGVAVVLGIILGGQMVAEAVQNNSIKSEAAKLTSIEDLDKTVTIQQQLEKIDQQQSEKSVDSRLFDVMAAINPPAPNEIKISTLKLNPEERTITIEGSAVNGYIALEVFKKTIINTQVQIGDGDDVEKEALATDIIAGDTSFGESADGGRILRFSFTFTYPEKLFEVSDDPVLIVTPTGRVDVTDSKLGVPESLFSNEAVQGEKDGE